MQVVEYLSSHFILFCLKKVNALSVVKIIISFQKTPALTFSVKQKHIQSDLFNKTPLSLQNWNLGSTLLHNSILKFDFEYIMIILRQYSKKNYRKIPKSSKIYIKCQILNRLGFNMSSQQQTDKTPHRGQHFKKAYGGF